MIYATGTKHKQKEERQKKEKKNSLLRAKPINKVYHGQ